MSNPIIYTKLHELTESTSLSGSDLIEISKWNTSTSSWDSRRISASFFEKGMSLYATVSANSGIWNLTTSPYLSALSGDVSITSPQSGDILVKSTKWVNVPISNYATRYVSGTLDFLSGNVFTTVNSTTADFSTMVRLTSSNQFVPAKLYSYSSLADFNPNNKTSAVNGHTLIYNSSTKKFDVGNIIPSRRPVITVVSNSYTPTTNDGIYVVGISVSEVQFPLQANSGDALTGTRYTFCKSSSYPNTNVKIIAPVGGSIADSNSGGNVYNNTSSESYATITITNVGGNKWLITGAHGTWVTA